MTHSIGYVNSVENKPTKKGGSFTVCMVTLEGMSEPYNMAYFGNKDIWSTLNHRIELEWEESQNGQWTNRAIKNFKVLPDSLQPPASVPTPTVGTTASGVVQIDQRQENINRQSAWKEAVGLMSMAISNGYSVVMGDDKKAKAANKDPEVLFEATKYFARRIKEDVQKGTWNTSDEEKVRDEDNPEEEIPF